MWEKELQKIGLSEKEAKVYLASLRLGKSPVQAISKEAGINRGTTYNVIESLTKKGLISSYQEGKKQYFFAESPDQLELLFKQQLEEIEHNRGRLKELLPELKQLDNKEKDKPVVRYFEGKNGIRAMVEDMFDVKSGTEIVMAYPYDEIKQKFTSKELLEWRNKRLKNNVHTRAIYTRNMEAIERPNIQSNRAEVPSDKYPLKSDVAIYENRIRIASLCGEKMIGIIIEDKDAADTLRSVFQLAWKAAKQDSDNQKNK